MSQVISFNFIPVFEDSNMPDGRVRLFNKNRGTRDYPEPLNENQQVQAVIDRLLGRDGALTLDMLQRAADHFNINEGIAPDVILLSPTTRREYIKLIEADQHFGIPTLVDTGTHRINYFGIDRSTTPSRK